MRTASTLDCDMEILEGDMMNPRNSVVLTENSHFSGLANRSTMLAKASKDLLYVGLVLIWVLGENKDVIKIHNNEPIKDVGKYTVHEVLESGRCIGEAKMHDQEIERAIAGMEGSLPLIARSNVDEREWIVILASNLVEATPINTQA